MLPENPSHGPGMAGTKDQTLDIHQGTKRAIYPLDSRSIHVQTLRISLAPSNPFHDELRVYLDLVFCLSVRVGFFGEPFGSVSENG